MRSQTEQPQARVQQAGHVKILTFTDGKIRDVEDSLARELDGHTDKLAGEHLLLDFSNVEYIRSAELGTLITLHKRLKAAGGRLTLFNLCSQVYEVFTVCRLHTFLEICREASED